MRIHHTRRTVSAGIALLATAPALVALATSSPSPASAAAPRPGASAAVNTLGLSVTGLDVRNDLRLELLGTRYRVTDAVPIQAGAGCRVVDVAGPRFGVTCAVTRNPVTGALASVRADLGGGDDRFLNLSPAPVRVQGNLGNDRLEGGPRGDLLSDSRGRNVLIGNDGPDALQTDFGGDTLPDLLDGGAGDDDLQAGPSDDVLRGGEGDDTMRGGLGADQFDGGPGKEDAVVYLESAHDDGAGVSVTIDGEPNDGTRFADEQDNVGKNVEQLFGTHDNDILQGSSDDNLIHGNLGNDVIVGGRGADDLDGGPGNDTLASNELFGSPVEDGDIDVLNGNSDVDSCRIPFEFVEDDATVSCELVNED